jgi:hypothetical protein
MEEKIINLRSEGKSYSEIKKILNCSKSTISYYCGENQKEKTKLRTKKSRKNNLLLQKVDTFKFRKNVFIERVIKDKRKIKNIINQINSFQKRDNNMYNGFNKCLEKKFSWKDVLEKFGENTICYLSGEKINLYENNYNLDHILPVSRGGDNSFENLGILHKVVNQIKKDLTNEELLEWCEKILLHNGYEVKKIKKED